MSLLSGKWCDLTGNIYGISDGLANSEIGCFTLNKQF